MTMSQAVKLLYFFFFQAEDGIRDAQESRGLGDVYKRQVENIEICEDIIDIIIKEEREEEDCVPEVCENYEISEKECNEVVENIEICEDLPEEKQRVPEVCEEQETQETKCEEVIENVEVCEDVILEEQAL
eukprot:TRINITY_DN881_c0_g1_i6.p1 TRINITY_DN881_c0_g1~~TRINITY_DN881_c0_g1_i6.p1  ORF type:complete len:131 (+),score=57.70 TRINITY_DN881_c0_g1_i6:18-410(+)